MVGRVFFSSAKDVIIITGEYADGEKKKRENTPLA
jgi:hypothetical protein